MEFPKADFVYHFWQKAADEISKRVKATGIDSKSFQLGHFMRWQIDYQKGLAKLPVEPEYDIWARDYERQQKLKLVNIALKKGYYGGKIISKDIEIPEVLRFIDDARDTLTDPENSMIVAESGNLC